MSFFSFTVQRKKKKQTPAPKTNRKKCKSSIYQGFISACYYIVLPVMVILDFLDLFLLCFDSNQQHLTILYLFIIVWKWRGTLFITYNFTTTLLEYVMKIHCNVFQRFVWPIGTRNQGADKVILNS